MILGPKPLGLGHLWAFFADLIETQWTHSGSDFEPPNPLPTAAGIAPGELRGLHLVGRWVGSIYPIYPHPLHPTALRPMNPRCDQEEPPSQIPMRRD